MEIIFFVDWITFSEIVKYWRIRQHAYGNPCRHFCGGRENVFEWLPALQFVRPILLSEIEISIPDDIEWRGEFKCLNGKSHKVIIHELLRSFLKHVSHFCPYFFVLSLVNNLPWEICILNHLALGTGEILIEREKPPWKCNGFSLLKESNELHNSGAIIKVSAYFCVLQIQWSGFRSFV